MRGYHRTQNISSFRLHRSVLSRRHLHLLGLPFHDDRRRRAHVVLGYELGGCSRVGFVLRVWEHEKLCVFVVPPAPLRRVGVGAVVVVQQYVLHELVPSLRRDHLLPLRHLLLAALGYQLLELLNQTRDVSRLEVFVPAANPPYPALHGNLEQGDGALAHARPRVLRDLQPPDHRRFALDEYRPGSIEGPRLLPYPGVEKFLRGLLVVPRRVLPEDAPAVLRHRLQVQHLRTLRLELVQLACLRVEILSLPRRY
mmetsp:Transcript_7095/g.31230  ORF Transcript_7095/g.31230 Transcript_7095/m.31230 type:complete len:254 (+) Transcript_7095:3562-4323(+)